MAKKIEKPSSANMNKKKVNSKIGLFLLYVEIFKRIPLLKSLVVFSGDFFHRSGCLDGIDNSISLFNAISPYQNCGRSVKIIPAICFEHYKISCIFIVVLVFSDMNKAADVITFINIDITKKR